MTDFVADTHSLIWYLEDSPRLSVGAMECFDACDRGEAIIHIPTICLVEIVYLQEKGRIPAEMKRLLDVELGKGGAGLLPADLSAEVANARSLISKRRSRYAGPNHCRHRPLSGSSIDQPRPQNTPFGSVKTIW